MLTFLPLKHKTIETTQMTLQLKHIGISIILIIMLLPTNSLHGQKYYPVQMVTLYADRDQRDTTFLEYQDWPVLLNKITTKIDGHEDYKGSETILTYNANHNLEYIIDKAIGLDIPPQEFHFEYHDRFLQKVSRSENGKTESVDIFYSAPTTTYSFADSNGNMWNYIYKTGDLVAVRSRGRDITTYQYTNDGQMDRSTSENTYQGPFKYLNQWPLAGYHMVSSLLRSTSMASMALRRQLIDFIAYDHSFIYLEYKMDEFGNPAQIEFRNAEDDTPFQTTYITYKSIY